MSTAAAATTNALMKPPSDCLSVSDSDIVTLRDLGRCAGVLGDVPTVDLLPGIAGCENVVRGGGTVVGGGWRRVKRAV